MSKALIDDHLLRDLLADDPGPALVRVLARNDPVTTNLYVYRLCKSVVSARGGALTGRWTSEQRRALGARLLGLPASIEVLPLQGLAYRMAEISDAHRLSTLGAEAVAAAEHLGARVCVWDGDDGPHIRGACHELGLRYEALPR